jgi:NADH dehydrogenase (ubiquinone) 1 alpha subcomplex subunit 5
MRRTFRQLAAVNPSQYLEGGAPTGLAGLRTHPSPRSALIYLYSRTLDKLAQFPEHSLYRQSTEALTKHRMSIVSSMEPEGFAAWKQEAQKVMDKHPGTFDREANVGGNVVSVTGKITKETHNGRFFVTAPPQKEFDESETEWNGEKPVKGGVEAGSYMKYDEGGPSIKLPQEPVLTANQ